MKPIENKQPNWADLFRHPVMMLGFGFGSGLSPKGPGTAGTLLGLLIFLPALLWSPALAWTVLVAGVIFGGYICGRSADLIGVHDHGGIVWDEFVGIWLVLLCLPDQNWLYWALAFVLFRFFDIVKPWPIGWVDQKVDGGLGIMLDDIIAACYSIIIIWALQTGFL